MINRKAIIQLVPIFVFFILAFGLIFILQLFKKEIIVEPIIKKELISTNISPLSGLVCDNYNQRPLAVMLASDPVARPLAGLSEADLVVEMSVITNEITRMMAVYICGQPSEVGSLRSARNDFITLAMGLDAIFVHWGGSHYALDLLDGGITDNIDALKNPYNSFYRKPEIARPHNGFTSIERLRRAADLLSYRSDNNFEGYLHKPETALEKKEKELILNYADPYNVKYVYQPGKNSYLRFRNNEPEMDKLNNKQIEAKNIIVMKAASRQIEGPHYNEVDIGGEGDCQVYQNGQVINCTWQKNKYNPNSKLYFYDLNNQEIAFVPGQIWLEVVEPQQAIIWF